MTASRAAPADSPPLADPVLLYDGYCGLCSRAVQWVLARDTAAVFRFAPLDSGFGDAVRGRHPELAGVDSLVLVDLVEGQERASIRSEAVLGILEQLPRWRLAARVGRLVPRWFRDFIYGWIARSRLWWFGRTTACHIPAPDQRSRFLLDP